MQALGQAWQQVRLQAAAGGRQGPSGPLSETCQSHWSQACGVVTAPTCGAVRGWGSGGRLGGRPLQ